MPLKPSLSERRLNWRSSRMVSKVCHESSQAGRSSTESIHHEDKTLPFQRQIETKQKELAPWTTKINSKQAEVDLAESERAMLAEKATGAQAAVDEATAALEKLQAEKENKERELSELNRERKTLQKQIKDGSTQLSVCLTFARETLWTLKTFGVELQ